MILNPGIDIEIKIITNNFLNNTADIGSSIRILGDLNSSFKNNL